MAWQRTLNALRRLVDVYDRANRAISLLSDRRLRLRALLRAGPLEEPVLDAGCGTGTMAEIAIALGAQPEHAVLLDPLPEMLRASKVRLGAAAGHVLGVFEALPFRSGAFGTALCGFSLRDARILGQAVRELARVVSPGRGLLVDVDLAKPDRPLRAALLAAYWRFIAPLLASLVAGARGALYAELYRTYLRYPPKRTLLKLLSGYFEPLWVSSAWGEGVLLLVAKRSNGKRL
jgi:ubiquinone/menaquinone biosynthesis C-methylase UbiE